MILTNGAVQGAKNNNSTARAAKAPSISTVFEHDLKRLLKRILTVHGSRTNNSQPSMLTSSSLAPTMSSLTVDPNATLASTLSLSKHASPNISEEKQVLLQCNNLAFEIDEIFDRWAKKCPNSVTSVHEDRNQENISNKLQFLQKILKTGDALSKTGLYFIALKHCYERFLRELEPFEKCLPTRNDERLNELRTKLFSLRVHGEIQQSVALFHICASHDSNFNRQQTLESCLSYMFRIQSRISETLEHEQHENLYFVVFNGTVHLYNLCSLIVRYGFSKEAATFLGFCIMSLESVITLCTAKYLGWRVKCYTALCACFENMNQIEQAQATAQMCLSKIEYLNDLEHSDLVPPPQSTVDLINDAREEINVVLFKYKNFSKANEESTASTDAQAAEAKFSNLLVESLSRPRSYISAVVNALTDEKRKTLRHDFKSLPPARCTNIRAIVHALYKLLLPHIVLYKRHHGLLSNSAEPTTSSSPVEDFDRDHQFVQEMESEERTLRLTIDMFDNQKRKQMQQMLQQKAADASKSAPKKDAKATVPAAATKKVDKNAKQPTPSQTPTPEEEPVVQELTPDEIATMYQREVANEVTVELLVALFKHAFNYEHYTIVDLLAPLIIELIGSQQNPQQPVSALMVMQAEVDLILALRNMELSTAKLQRSTDPSQQDLGTAKQDILTFADMLDSLIKRKDGVFVQERKTMVTDAALILYEYVSNFAGTWGLTTTESSGVAGGNVELRVLSCVYDALMAADFSDIFQLTAIGIRLGLLYEKMELYKDAAKSLRLCLRAVERQRSEIVYHDPDYLSSISVSLTREDIADQIQLKKQQAKKQQKKWEVEVPTQQPEKPQTPAPSIDSQNSSNSNLACQRLYCIHTELLTHIYRVEMKIGIEEAHKIAIQKHNKELQELMFKQNEQAHIFGQLGTKEKKRLQQLEENPPEKPKTNPKTESKLQEECNVNCYEQALLNMVLCEFRSTKEKQLSLLEKSSEQLTRAEQLERSMLNDLIFSYEQQRAGSSAPNLFKRTKDIICLKLSQQFLQGEVQYLIVYGKSAKNGANVVPKDTTLIGTGVLLRPDEELIISGLSSNENYVFAVQKVREVKDSEGTGIKIEPVGEMSGISTEICSLFPLPLSFCWALLAETAFRYECYSIAKHAARKLYNIFVTKGQEKPVWELNPVNVDSLNLTAVKRSAIPLLRSLVNSFLILSEIDILNERTNEEEETEKINYKLSQQQYIRLRACNKLYMALQVASMIDDHHLIGDVCTRIYKCLTPILNQMIKSRMLLKPLFVAGKLMADIPQAKFATSNEIQAILARIIYEGACLTDQLNEAVLLKQYAELFCVAYGKAKLACYQQLRAKSQTPLPAQLTPQQQETLTVMMPEEYQFLCQYFFCKEDCISVLLKQNEQPLNTEQQQQPLRLFDDIFVKVCATIHTDPSKAFEALQKDFANHSLYPRVALKVLQELLRRKKHDQVLSTSNEIVATLNMRRKRLVQKEQELAAVVLNNAAPAAPQKSADPKKATKPTNPPASNPVSPQPPTSSPSPSLEGGLSEENSEERRKKEAAIRLSRVLWPMFIHSKYRRLREKLKQTDLSYRSQIEVITGLSLLEQRMERLTNSQNDIALSASDMGKLARLPCVREEIIEREIQSVKDKVAHKDWRQMKFDVINKRLQEQPPTSRSPVPAPSAPTKPGVPLAPTKGGQKTPVPPVEEEKKKPNDSTTPIGQIRERAEILGRMSRACELAVRIKYWRQLYNACTTIYNITNLFFAKDGYMRKVSADGGNTATAEEDTLELISNYHFAGSYKSYKVAAEGLLEMLQDLSKGDTVDHVFFHRGAAIDRKTSDVRREPDSATMAVTDMHSDLEWTGNLKELDLDWIVRFFVLALKALFIGGSFNSLVQIGTKFNNLTKGHYADRLLPTMVEAQKLLVDQKGPNVAEIESLGKQLTTQLEKAIRDKPKAILRIEECRKLLGRYLLDEQINFLGSCNLEGGTRTKSSLHQLQQSRLSTRSAFSLERSTKVTEEQQHQPLQLSYQVVVDSYDQTCQFLRKKHEVLLLIQAFNELGDLHYCHQKNTRAANAWNNAIDCVFETVEALKNWRDVLNSFYNNKNRNDICTDPNSAMLNKLGIWRCLLGGIAISKVSKYIFAQTNQQHKCIESCILAAAAFSAPFASSLQHPQRCCDFADYAPEEIISSHHGNFNLFEDQSRLNHNQLLEALQFTSRQLVKSGYYLSALPVLSMYEYVAHKVCRELFNTVEARTLKVYALIHIGNFKKASRILCLLFGGKRLPERVIAEVSLEKYVANTEQPITEQVPAAKPGVAPNAGASASASAADAKDTKEFSNELPLESDANRNFILKFTQTMQLPPEVANVYGEYLTHQITFARCLFLIQVAQYDLLRSMAPCDLTTTATDAKKDPKAAKAAAQSTTAVPTYVAEKALSAAAASLNRLRDEDLKSKAGSQQQFNGVNKLYLKAECLIKYYLARIAFLRAKFTEAAALIKECIEYFQESGPESESPPGIDDPELVNLGSQFWFRCFQLGAEIAMQRQKEPECKQYCAMAKELSDSVGSLLVPLQFDLIAIRFDLFNGTGQIFDCAKKLQQLIDANNKYMLQLDKRLLAQYISDTAFVQEQILGLDLRDSIKVLQGFTSSPKYSTADGRTMSEAMYEETEKILEQHLYDLGFYLDPQHEQSLQRYMPYVPPLIFAKLKLAGLLTWRGNYEAALEKLETIIALSKQNPSPSMCPQMISASYFAIGRLRRLLLLTNTMNSNDEYNWGSATLATKSYDDKTIFEELNDLRFLSPVTPLEKCLETTIVEGFHDHELIRNSLLELVYIYGSKMSKGDELQHVIIASSYLVIASRVNEMKKRLFERIHEMSETPIRAFEEMPQFAAEEIQALYVEMNAPQSQFAEKQAAAESAYASGGTTNPRDKVRTPATPNKRDARAQQQQQQQQQQTADASATSLVPSAEVLGQSQYALQYFISLLRSYETWSPNDDNANALLENKILKMHKYLQKNFPPYSAECILASVPTNLAKDNKPAFLSGLVCTQFYTVDAGPSSFKTAAQEQQKQQQNDAVPLEELEDSHYIPMITMFYLCCPPTSGASSNTTSIKDVPLLGMKSLQQHTIVQLYREIRELRYSMTTTNDTTAAAPTSTTASSVTVQAKGKPPAAGGGTTKPGAAATATINEASQPPPPPFDKDKAEALVQNIIYALKGSHFKKKKNKAEKFAETMKQQQQQQDAVAAAATLLEATTTTTTSKTQRSAAAAAMSPAEAAAMLEVSDFARSFSAYEQVLSMFMTQFDATHVRVLESAFDPNGGTYAINDKVCEWLSLIIRTNASNAKSL